MRKYLIWAGYFCGGMAFVILPILFGPAGVVLGCVNIQRGDRLHGQRQIALAAVGLVVGLLVGIVVNVTPISQAGAGRCSQMEIAARVSDTNADIQRALVTPGQQRAGLAAQSLFVEQTSRVTSAILRGEMKTACVIVADLERRIR